MKALLLAIQFLTRLPTPALADLAPRDWGRSALFYPLVGLLIGTLLAALQFAIGASAAPLQAALLLTVWVLLTGGLHLDGLADTADAWVGGHGDRQRTLDIMKDPRSGPAAVSAIVLVLLLKFAALAVLLKSGFWPALLLAPLLGRASLLGMLLSTPYVRAGGMGAAIAGHLPRKAALILLLATALGVCFAADGWKALLAVLVVGFLLRRAFLARLDGMTGDMLGAAVELSEAAALLALALEIQL
ncbi:adenosylcobinamide-GDP ribazoletransferase [Sulfurimicrobium lacus]|uniref:Adenosylcobinamide-GDP ribazoletransferase n=1 Tax=Sulfurimicrobium lacus TaxID=2715678 RepID=A0A6F8VEB5_9PROT|nr:adenosylcobinamide-GDP ribazoletransferase [Sulfurimicrobium lacus]BCB28058.1 adenosylcobinamide-GDP ribazoletransferase [Sulfurimicrobium lacus]